MKFRDTFTEEGLQDIRNKLEDLFEAKAGFIIMGNASKKRVTDAYSGLCAHDILELIKENVLDAEALGYLAKCSCNKEDKNGKQSRPN